MREWCARINIVLCSNIGEKSCGIFHVPQLFYRLVAVPFVTSRGTKTRVFFATMESIQDFHRYDGSEEREALWEIRFTHHFVSLIEP